MEHFEYLKSISGVCRTPCPYYNGVMIGSANCEDCIFCEYLMPNGETPYVECIFKELLSDKKETKPNSFGNRLKVTLDASNDPKYIGYIDGYIGDIDEGIYAIVYSPKKNIIYPVRIKDLRIIKEGE